jgi:hypothetical protein
MTIIMSEPGACEAGMMEAGLRRLLEDGYRVEPGACEGTRPDIAYWPGARRPGGMVSVLRGGASPARVIRKATAARKP